MQFHYDPEYIEDGLKGFWDEYVQQVRQALTQEEKNQINNLPRANLSDLMTLRQYYLDENEKSITNIKKKRRSQEGYLKWLTSGVSNLDKDIAVKRVQEETSQLRTAILKQVKTMLFLQAIENAIKNNTSFLNQDTPQIEQLKNDLEESKKQNSEINRELANAHSLIKKQKRKLKLPDISVKDLREIVDSCRKKNGKINYSKIGRQLGVTHHTAKRYCEQHRIKD
jgi:hypothetical protein